MAADESEAHADAARRARVGATGGRCDGGRGRVVRAQADITCILKRTRPGLLRSKPYCMYLYR